MRILASWIGSADLRGCKNDEASNAGPIVQALAARSFDRVLLLADVGLAKKENVDSKTFVRWLKKRLKEKTPLIDVEAVDLSSPTNMTEIHRAAIAALDRTLDAAGPGTELTLFLSPGTPAMAAVWILIGKSRFPANFLESSRESGVKDAEVPFDISAEFLPTIFDGPDRRIADLSLEVPPAGAQFGDIVYRSQAMGRLIAKAKKAAARTVTVLIEGESGTGKELLAKAIVNSGPRKGKPLKIVNCGAIPSELVESELFGHKKGAFTGADRDREGYFEAAHTGTLFLDEVGELPPLAQVKLLRVLQEGAVTRIGESEPRKVDIRVIAATNRTLVDEVAAGRFREDLFYRLAQVVLKVPPLRERQGEISLLIDHLLAKANEEHQDDPAVKPRRLSNAAKNLLLKQPWRGNVRELQSTLRRAVIWSDADVISDADIVEALLPSSRPSDSSGGLLPPLGDDFSIEHVLETVRFRYVDEALRDTAGNKSRAAQLLGLNNSQTLANWLARRPPPGTAIAKARHKSR